ncbi:hypothetical protein ACOKFD_12565 [Flagellimonas sp. S174]|uniref:hypothetical protein n=1 Tax=Flagellimonas sp. S174 TaxID=3410790 RepID=UPI003BF4DA8E
MNKLDYCVSLRAKGFDSKDMRKKMKENGFEESEMQYYLKKSDEIFLNQSIHYRGLKSKGKKKNSLKMIGLGLSLILLVGVIFGYVRIGLLGLFIVWSLVGYSSYKR